MVFTVLFNFIINFLLSTGSV